MRPIDLAREHGLSAQAIRNYDAAGALPPTDRADTGYRHYTPRHARALRAFLTLREGHGHQHALEIMRAVHRNDLPAAYRLLDTTHVTLHNERTTHAEVATALTTLTTAPRDPDPAATSTSHHPDPAANSAPYDPDRAAKSTPHHPNPAPHDPDPAARSAPHDPDPAETSSPPLTVGELAHRLGVHAATLRAWEAAGILRPERERSTGYRLFGPDCVRDAEIARQLRRGGHPLDQIARFLESLRAAGGAEALRAFLDAWQDRLTARGRALLAGAAQLDAYLRPLE
ncbi:MerR family transcriptional regulator [Nocardia sp. NPDC004068]|uniref:TioE family transcriptional regulator n=1 Tax=Nocardia sp. NPDC004068 TaxID=3364303 RepID=UPI0036BE8264